MKPELADQLLLFQVVYVDKNIRGQIIKELKLMRSCVSQSIITFYDFVIDYAEVRIYQEYMDVGCVEVIFPRTRWLTSVDPAPLGISRRG